MRRLARLAVILLVSGALLAGTFYTSPSVDVSAQEPVEGSVYSDPVLISKDNNDYEIDISGNKVEIGDTSVATFDQAVKLNRWGGESWITLSLATTSKILTDSTIIDGKVVWENNLFGISLYGLTREETSAELGAFEYEVILKEKPSSNSLYFNIDFSPDVEFYYQPPLTEEFTSGWSEEFQCDILVTDTEVIGTKTGDILVYRPDNVVGSYAVYSNDKRDHAIGQTNYMTGQIGFFYRPKAIDSKGWEVWGELHIDPVTKTMVVTLPQEFIDKAVYPIRHAAGDTFGYTSDGASEYGSSNYRGNIYTGAAGTGTSMSAMVKGDTKVFRCALYEDSATNSVFVKGTDEGTAGAAAGWVQVNFTANPTLSAIDYIVCLWSGSGIDLKHMYNSGGTYKYKIGEAYPNWADPTSFATSGTSRILCNYCTYTPDAGVVAPTVVTNNATSVEETTATLSGNITATGGANCTDRGFEWDVNSGAPYADNWTENGNFGVSNFTHGITSLPTGTTIYYRAIALNSAGWGYGLEVTFLTKPAAPTNVSATDGSSTANVTITWTKSTGATDYHVWRDAVDLGATGDVATFDDVGATAGTITNAGTVTATDGSQTAHVVLSLAGEATGTTSHTYKVVASNATGDSGDSATDTGYRGVGAITYQWQRSAGDADAGYGNIGGATTDPYNDTAAPAGTISHSGNVTASDGTSSSYVTLSLANEATTDGAGRYYQCIVSATGASNSPQTSDNNRGYRTVGAITFQWQRSAADSDASYGNIAGGTTDPYNDTGAPAYPAARFFQCIVSSVDASNTPQTSDSDRGYRAEAPPPPVPEPDPRDPDLVYLELRPDLDETGIVKKVHVPTEVYPGIFFAYSLPIWVAPSSNETLYFMVCVPDRWNESSDILVHAKTATSDNQSGNLYELELAWDKVTPNVVEAMPTGAPNIVTANRTVDSELTYACYRDWFTVDYDIEGGDPIESNDTIAFRLRRFGGSDNLTSELIVFEFAVLFARGDLLSDPEDGIWAIIEGGEGMILFVLAFIAVCLTVAMFVTRERMLGFPCVLFWAILGAFAYTESSTPWGDWQFYLFFASAFGMTIFCAIAMYGLREKKDAIGDEELEKGEGTRIGEGEEEYGSEVGEGEKSKPSSRTQELRARAEKRRKRL